MEAQRIRDGVKLMQEGDKASSKGLFRKPDWDVASGCYEQAAICFKNAKSYDQAVQAYMKASEAFFKADGTHLAGKAVENAAQLVAQNLNQPQRAAELYQRASNFFMTAGSIDRAAEQFQKAGRTLENTDINAAIEMYSSACSLYEMEDRGRMAIDIFKKATALLVRSKKYEKAIDMLHRQSAVLRKLTNRSHLFKANLSVMIVLFAIGDEVEAEKQFNAMCNEEAEIGQALLDAYEQGDQELLEHTVRRQHISFLDNEIAKLSRTLTVPGEMLSSGMGAASVASSGSTGYASRPNSRPSTRTPAGNNDIHAMSPAQVRAELYSTPMSKKQYPDKTTTEFPHTSTPRQPQPPQQLTHDDLDEEFARLNMQPNAKKAQAPLEEEDDDFDLR
ncbi:hypothetical protein BX666DRAFT_1851168 [Dichotomocladium elegans]|nr:hypothetical protein BX666DRAFT_1851168 [Dichotomocladium elegans]